jgi:dTDP-4-amino-4,6-dideoxygalactose transaminase
VHVKDAARACLALLEAPANLVSGQIFNVGSDISNTRIIDLAQRVSRIIGNIGIEIPKDDDDLRNYRVQFGKIRQALGFKCDISIDEGIVEVRDELLKSGIEPFSADYFNVQRMKQLLDTPVDEGGEPIAARFIAVSKPFLGPEEENAVIQALRSGWLTSGPNIQRFEKAFADTVSARHAVAVVSCTAALHLSLAHLGVKPGDEVITSPMTWGSTGNTIITMGAKPVFVDIDRETLNMNPAELEQKINSRTRAIIPVDMAGLPCDLDAIHAIAARHGVPVIEDAAHALGAAYKGAPVGTRSEFTCFSFYAIKNITTMEGGIITTSDESVARHLRLLAFHGIPVTPWERYGRSAVPSPPEVAEPGYKYLMSNVSAAIGVEQLKRFAHFKAMRRRIANMYNTVLQEVDEIRLPAMSDDTEHGWHLYVIHLNLDRLSKSRDEIAAALRRENIGTSVNFFGLHLHKYYREVLGIKPSELPEATAASYEILSLPLHPQMTDRNVHEVVAALKKVLAHARKR